jgi:predicted RNA-binding protein with PUA-like domain
VAKGKKPLGSPGSKRGQAPFVRSTLRAVPAKGDSPLFEISGWLFKEEPSHFSYADLERDGTTLWDGVDNNLARQHLRNVKAGDRVLYYHTGNEKAVVGEMTVVEGAMPGPADDPKAAVVRVRAVKKWPRPVTLAQIKQEPELADWDLVRNSRLSVMPVTAEQWRRVEELAADGS